MPALIFACVVMGAALVASSSNAMLVNAGEASVKANEPEKMAVLTRVVKVLEEMQKEIETETKLDKKTYDELKCWCKTIVQDKTDARDSAEEKVGQLTSSIEALMARKGHLTSEIAQYTADIATAEKTLKEMTELRSKESQANHGEQVDLVQAIRQLEGAIAVLAKHNTQDFLQQGEEYQESAAILQMLPGLRKLVHKHLNLMGWLEGSPAKDILLKFINANPDILEPDLPVRTYSFLQNIRSHQMPGTVSTQPFKSYGSQSGQVYGVLQQMLEDFKKDLKDKGADESMKAATYTELKTAKKAELAELVSVLKAKRKDLSDCQVSLVEDQADKDDLEASMAADFSFITEAMERCKAADFEYDKRSKMRSEELYAVSEAIKILSEDKIRDAAATTFQGKAANFMQIEQTSATNRGGAAVGALVKRRAKALAMLQKAAKEAPRLKLILRALQVSPFSKVLQAVDELIQKLLTEDSDDTKLRDFCIQEFATNKADTAAKQSALDSLIAELDSLEAAKKTLTEEKAALMDEIEKTQVSMQQMSMDRKAENLAFQSFVAENMRTVEALDAAYEKLSTFYGKPQEAQSKKGSMTPGMEEAPELKVYENNDKSQSIMSMIMKLKGEAEGEQEEAEQAEQLAEDSYSKMIFDMNASIKALQRSVVQKTEELADNDEATQTAKTNKLSTLDDMEELADTKAGLHKQCDYIMKNFDARMEARAAERVALGNVKAILSE